MACKAAQIEGRMRAGYLPVGRYFWFTGTQRNWLKSVNLFIQSSERRDSRHI